MLPYGSHPLTDPRWSSHRLRIEHDTMRHSRLQKTAAVAQWDLGLKALRVCISRKSEDLNCGRCEKCLRTMLMLLCLGKLAAAPFPKQDLTRDEVARIEIDEPYQFRQYGQMLPALQQIGRHDLHDTIDGKLQAYRSRAAS